MAAKKKNRSGANKPPLKQPDFSLPAGLDSGNRLFWALCGFLLLALVVYFREFIFHSNAILLGSDMITQGLQTRKIGVDAVMAGGSYPLWNPLSFCGLPYAGGLTGPMFYPLSLLYFIMPLFRAIGWTFLLMMLFGGLFCYLWIRELNLSKAAASLCAVAFTFTGWVASGLHGGHDGRIFVILLTPLVFFFLERGFNRRKLIWFLLMGLVVALQILTPQLQMMYFSCLAVTAYAIYRLVAVWREDKSIRPFIRLGLMYTAGFVLAVSLAAVQFFPTAVNRQLAHRQEGLGLGYEGYAHATSFSMHPLETAGLVVPGFTGEPAAYWSAESFKLHSEYMGLLPLMFAVVALARRRHRKVWFFSGLAAAALLWNYGGYTPFFRLPYHLLPVVKSFRGPNMMFFVFAFSLITLAGYGIDYVLGAEGRDDQAKAESSGSGFKVLLYCLGALGIVLVVIGGGKDALPNMLSGMLPEKIGQARLAVLRSYYPQIIRSALISAVVGGAIVGLVWMWRSRVIPLVALVVLLAVLTWADLMRMDRHWLNTGDVNSVYSRNKIVDHLQAQDLTKHRVYFYPSPVIREGYSDYWDNSLLFFKIPTVNASMPLRLKWFEKLSGTHTQRNLARDPRLWKSLQEQLGNPQITLPNTIHHRFWDLMAADHIMFRNSRLTPFFEREYPFLEKVLEDGRTARILYRNPGAWERYRLFGAFEVIEDDDAVLNRINDPAFDPGVTLILNEPPDFDASSLAGVDAGQGTVEPVYHGYDRISLKVNCQKPCLLYFAESYHPFWQATVDGRPARVYRANLAMRAVYVPAGGHEVEMSYRSRPFCWGGRVSILSLLVLAGAVGWCAYRNDW
ncbi:MAG: YfhO family protein [Candidatus Glassbacteria bacterium]|nr:YfhO family protein [Candidatus Glassbacteria bacterium]